ncbi:MAG: multidrug efflux pump subunit AcrB [Rhodoferax sp.]|jgi:multidrug efflux pump subunit AcrB
MCKICCPAPAEQALSQIVDIEHTCAVAWPGMAVVTVQFKVGVPRTEALVRLYDVLNANQNGLPRELGTLSPVVKPKGLDGVSVMGVTLWSRDALPTYELEWVAHAVEVELKRVSGTREVADLVVAVSQGLSMYLREVARVEADAQIP